MEKYVIMGYEFDNKASADTAKNELEMISKIKSQGNMSNHKIALSVYNKLLEDNLFKTPVGLEYLRSLQKELLAVKTIDKSEIKAIKINDEKNAGQSKKNDSRCCCSLYAGEPVFYSREFVYKTNSCSRL